MCVCVHAWCAGQRRDRERVQGTECSEVRRVCVCACVCKQKARVRVCVGHKAQRQANGAKEQRQKAVGQGMKGKANRQKGKGQGNVGQRR